MAIKLRCSCWTCVTGLAIAALCGSLGLNFLLYQEAVGTYRELQTVRLDPTRAAHFENENSTLPAPAPGTGRVVFFGDSRIEMWRPLPESAGLELINRGWGGETTGQALLRVERDVLALQPDVVVIQLGINDLKAVGVLPDAEDAIRDQCARNLKGIVDAITSHDISVLLLTVFPVGPVSPARRPVWSDATLGMVAEVNTALQSLSGPRVRVLNCDDVLAEGGRVRDSFAIDAFHLRREAYQALNEFVAPELTRLTEARGASEGQPSE